MLLIIHLLKDIICTKTYLSKGKDTLLRSNTTSLDHDEILLNLSVVRESSHGVDGFVGQIVFRGCVVFDQLSVFGVESITDIVDLLVDLCTMMVSLLTSTSNGELDSGRMPCTNTSDLSETLVCLTWQFLTVPS